jgi:hypothetical protein
METPAEFLHAPRSRSYHGGMLKLAQTMDVPIPRTTDWVPVLLLTILWIFVGAAVAGALFRYFRPRPPAV